MLCINNRFKVQLERQYQVLLRKSKLAGGGNTQPKQNLREYHMESTFESSTSYGTLRDTAEQGTNK